jgi:hypothetical protein
MLHSFGENRNLDVTQFSALVQDVYIFLGLPDDKERVHDLVQYKSFSHCSSSDKASQSVFMMIAGVLGSEIVWRTGENILVWSLGSSMGSIVDPALCRLRTVCWCHCARRPPQNPCIPGW